MTRDQAHARAKMPHHKGRAAKTTRSRWIRTLGGASHMRLFRITQGRSEKAVLHDESNVREGSRPDCEEARSYPHFMWTEVWKSHGRTRYAPDSGRVFLDRARLWHPGTRQERS
jgi:hypothetical protein